MQSIFDKLGGEPAMDAAVDLFYEKVLADARIKHFFANTDMDKQRDHQKKFLSFAFGGAANYTGRGMREAHAELVEKMGLDESHFDAVMENLAATLQELQVPAEIIGEAAAVAESVRNEVLGR